MMKAQSGGSILLLCTLAFALSSTGCGKDDKKPADQQARATDKADPTGKPSPTKGDGKKDLGTPTKHAGWWCEEHGVPEHICSLCNDEHAAKLKKEGDWCKMHDRAKSQCFKCDPKLYKDFEDMYVAKFDSKPKPPPKAEFEK